MEKKYLYRFILGTAIMAAGILSAAFLDIDVSISIILFNMGLIVFVATALRRFRRGDLPDRDERTKKLAAYGITYSWLLTLIAIMVLFWSQYLGLTKLTAEGVINILLLCMIFSAYVFRWYFVRKGDIE